MAYMSVITLSNAKQFSCAEDVSILDAAKAKGLVLEHSCRTGRCGICKTKIINGDTRLIQAETGLSVEEAENGFILTCCRTVTSDTLLDTEDLGVLATIKTQTLPCKIDSLNYLAADIMRVVLRLPPTANFIFSPGQYINVIAKNSTRRSYSIASSNHLSGKIELHIRRVAEGSMSEYWFNHAKENDLLRFEGPHGTFGFRKKMSRNIIFLATGTGIAPIKSMLEYLDDHSELTDQQLIHIYWGGRTLADIYWQPHFNHIIPAFHPVLSRVQSTDWNGHHGYVQDAVLSDDINLNDSVVYACGSPQMIRAAQQLLFDHGLKTNNFFSDAFVNSQ
jgi:CDP-4-dehydro-6-deoxyglucose reductase, E3